MNNQTELVAEARAVSGKQVKRLRREGIIPAVMYGHNQPSVPLQVNRSLLQKLLDRSGKNIILSLKFGNQPAVQALIKKVERDPISREITHVDFYRIAATEKLKTRVPLHFVNEAPAASLSGVTVLRSMDEVMVECLPADLPSSIQVDLSQLREVGDVIRVGDLTVGPGVTILTDANDMVAGLSQHIIEEKIEEAPREAEEAEGKAEEVEGKGEAA